MKLKLSKDEQDILGILLGAWLVINFITCLCGIFSYDERHRYNDACENNRRIDWLFPGFVVGCYLGAPWKCSKEKTND